VAAEASQPVEIIIWCSNDYLGMGRHSLSSKPWHHPRAAMVLAPAVRGTSPATVTPWLNRKPRSPIFTRKSSALVFSSGYVANEANLGTLGTVLLRLRDLLR
jgi:5-aminolevulinate synthase